jgi:hypothetical protein
VLPHLKSLSLRTSSFDAEPFFSAAGLARLASVKSLEEVELAYNINRPPHAYFCEIGFLKERAAARAIDAAQAELARRGWSASDVAVTRTAGLSPPPRVSSRTRSKQ